MNPSDLRDRAARLRALSAATLDRAAKDELAYLAGEYEAAADQDAADFTVSTVFPR